MAYVGERLRLIPQKQGNIFEAGNDYIAKIMDGDRAIGIHETIMPDLHEACGKHMLKQTLKHMQNTKES